MKILKIDFYDVITNKLYCLVPFSSVFMKQYINKDLNLIFRFSLYLSLAKNIRKVVGSKLKYSKNTEAQQKTRHSIKISFIKVTTRNIWTACKFCCVVKNATATVKYVESQKLAQKLVCSNGWQFPCLQPVICVPNLLTSQHQTYYTSDKVSKAIFSTLLCLIVGVELAGGWIFL